MKTHLVPKLDRGLLFESIFNNAWLLIFLSGKAGVSSINEAGGARLPINYR